MDSSSDDEINILDSDSCTTDELNKLFNRPLYLSAEEAVSLKKDYILHLDVARSFDKIVTTTAQNAIHVFDLRHPSGMYDLNQIELKTNFADEICGVKFANTSTDLLFVSTTMGQIFQYDLRTSENNVELFELEDRNGKLLTCFDINSNDSILCAGTEHSQSESYLLFFDTRQRSSLGVYQESHRDDLTQIKFHTTAQNLLASGSTDGLINVFNISETTEDDALQYCLNTENSVQTLNWHPTSDPNKNRISCITHTNDFHLYDVEESEEIVKFKRDDITNLIKRKSSNECYLVNCHTTGNSDVLLVAGSNYKKGECLRTLTLHGKDFLPRNNLGDNKQIVRCSFYSDKNDVLITAGEGGIVSLWQSEPLDKITVPENRKETKKHKDKKVKPY